jgi:DNA-binding LacI/PurR family transcriptional regulator
MAMSGLPMWAAPKASRNSRIVCVDGARLLARPSYQLLALPEPPTAIFAATDYLAFGILKTCNQIGCAVPEGIALVGFDNVPFGEIALTPLTSVDGSGLNMGQRAMRLLIDRIESEPVPSAPYSPVRMIIQPTLCVRQSCGCRPGKEIT